ncbi:MAG TPA: DUF5615 family PIN-like protein [Opitutaceae bacterium]
MKLLFDENLSPSLVTLLADLHPQSTHVRDIGLARSPDRVVWQHAAEKDFAIARGKSRRSGRIPIRPFSRCRERADLVLIKFDFPRRPRLRFLRNLGFPAITQVRRRGIEHLWFVFSFYASQCPSSLRTYLRLNDPVGKMK